MSPNHNWTLEIETNRTNILWIDQNALRINPLTESFLALLSVHGKSDRRRIDGSAVGYELPIQLDAKQLTTWLSRLGIEREKEVGRDVPTGLGGDGKPLIPFSEMFVDDIIAKVNLVDVPAHLRSYYSDNGVLVASGSLADLTWRWRESSLRQMEATELYNIYCEVGASVTDEKRLRDFRYNRGKSDFADTFRTIKPVPEAIDSLLAMGVGERRENGWYWYPTVLYNKSVADMKRIKYCAETGVVQERYEVLQPDAAE